MRPAARLSRLLAPALGALLLAGCAVPASAPAPVGDLVREARWFMDAYAADIRAGNREALADRYDRRGAYFWANGTKELVPWETIREDYLAEWSPPADFDWQDLSFEPIPPDAVAVAGRFHWCEPEGVRQLSYTALLVRQEGKLRIRLEDESEAVVPLPDKPCRATLARR